MNIIMLDKEIKFNGFKPFTEMYSKVYLSFDENEWDINKNNVNVVKEILKNLNFSWDGVIYWFANKDKENLLDCLNEWFAKKENHPDLDDLCISNCVLVKDTPNGICLIDTQYDMSSSIDKFIQEFNGKYPDVTYKEYQDSHLTDNLNLGREMVEDEFELFYFLYKENVIDYSFFLLGFYAESFTDEESNYYQILPNEKEICVVGIETYIKENIQDALENAEYRFTRSIKNNCWIWYGNKLKEDKVPEGNDKNILVNSVDEVIEMAYKTYLERKVDMVN